MSCAAIMNYDDHPVHFDCGFDVPCCIYAKLLLIVASDISLSHSFDGWFVVVKARTEQL